MEGGAKWRREIYSSDSELESRRGVHRRTGHCPVLPSFLPPFARVLLFQAIEWPPLPPTSCES